MAFDREYVAGVVLRVFRENEDRVWYDRFSRLFSGARRALEEAGRSADVSDAALEKLCRRRLRNARYAEHRREQKFRDRSFVQSEAAE